MNIDLDRDVRSALPALTLSLTLRARSPGIVLCALGIPLEMYTVIFTIARVVGWCAQWREYAGEAGAKITRPRQLYQGSVRRGFVGIKSRTSTSMDYEDYEMTSRRTAEPVVTEERVFASMRSLERSKMRSGRMTHLPTDEM